MTQKHVQNVVQRYKVLKCKLRKIKYSCRLKSLHWLPVPERIKFKIASLTFKVLNFAKLSYLSELISSYQPTRSLRLSGTNLLKVSDIQTEIGRRSFSYAASTIWNSLPQDLRSCTSITISRAI